MFKTKKLFGSAFAKVFESHARGDAAPSLRTAVGEPPYKNLDELDPSDAAQVAEFKDALAKGPIGRPVNVETNQPMNDEQAAKFRAMLIDKGFKGVEFAPGTREAMEAAGITEDDLLAAFLRSVDGRQ